ncbi:hypothetical protein EVAR_86943_1 [Eumeta japonica]|uniref:MADF domain-containing protein n=1 Tax=Eumeta variegata TaxID=151549 RepID=A0A4C1W6K3_EUMVA|nr:hypothetical protein EVAR_86943_1 [Eumeta japonica]
MYWREGRRDAGSSARARGSAPACACSAGGGGPGASACGAGRRPPLWGVGASGAGGATRLGPGGRSVRRLARPTQSPLYSPSLPPFRAFTALALEHLVMEHFIETVKKYPCLWNSTAIEYRDQELKDAAWAEVMKETNLTSVKEVKLKWKKLRDSYRDALKRHADAPAPPAAALGPGGKKVYPWKYMGLMQFLQPHMGNRRKPPDEPPLAPTPVPAHTPTPTPAHNGVGTHSSEDSSSSSESSSAPGTRAGADTAADANGSAANARQLGSIDRKLEYLCALAGAGGARRRRRARDPPDPLDLFFEGMCQATKRLPYAAQIAVKKTLFGAVVAAEEALLAEHQSYALWAQAAAAPGARADSSSDEPGRPSRTPRSDRPS